LEQELKVLYRDIINGYSEAVYNKKPVFVKHISLSDDLPSEAIYLKTLNKCKDSGIPTEKEKIEELQKSDEWTKKEESELISNRNYLQNLRKTLDKLIVEAQKTQIRKEIKETEKKLTDLLTRRTLLVGRTAESFADREKNEYLIKNLIFWDKNLSIPVFQEEDWEDLSFSDLENLFVNDSNRFSIENLKEISVSYFFYNYFSLTDKDSPYKVFVDSPLKLTFYQQKVLIFAKKVRSIFENFDIPEEKTNSYDAIVDHYEFLIKKSKKPSKGGDSQGYGIVGATKEEIQRMGSLENAVTPYQMLQKSGKKRLTKKDFTEQ
jgi:hypothetical protein